MMSVISKLSDSSGLYMACSGPRPKRACLFSDIDRAASYDEPYNLSRLFPSPPNRHHLHNPSTSNSTFSLQHQITNSHHQNVQKSSRHRTSPGQQSPCDRRQTLNHPILQSRRTRSISTQWQEELPRERYVILSKASFLSDLIDKKSTTTQRRAKLVIDKIKDTQLTSSVLLDHYNRPRNVGSMQKNDADVGTGLVGAPACGDVMKLQIRVDPNDNTISDVKFKTFGCGSAIASSSYLTELVRGMTLEQASRIKNTEIAKELCLPPVKREWLRDNKIEDQLIHRLLTVWTLVHCSMLAEDAIKSAISNYYTKNPKAKQTDLGGTGAAMPKIEVETITAAA